MKKHTLKSSPRSLDILLEAAPRTTAFGDFGFVSTEVALADAKAAHELRSLLRDLFRATAQVHQQLHVLRGKEALRRKAALAGALERARPWV